MNLEEFQKLYKQTEANLKANLVIDTVKHAKGLPVREDSLQQICTQFKVMDGSNIAKKLQELNTLIASKKDVRITQREQTKAVLGSYDFIGTLYNLYYKVLRTEIQEEQVKDKMKTIVKNQLKKELKTSWISLECKVMELFKAGTITWEDVVEAHRNACEF